MTYTPEQLREWAGYQHEADEYDRDYPKE